MSAYVEFEFDLPGALLVRLIEVLDGLDRASLTQADLAEIPEEQGVYQLFLDDRLVYIGKTDAEAGLHKRLTRHSRKIRHRVGLDPARVSFKAVRVFVFTAVDLEADLIRHYGGMKSLDWNGSGFGSNDPGRERDTTKVKAGNYDAVFPIDVDRPIGFAIQAGETAMTVLSRMRTALPYTFRFQGGGRGKANAETDLAASMPIDIPGPISPRTAIAHVLGQLPREWQATKLLGYVILYKEAPRDYPQGEIIGVGGAPE